MRREYGFSPVQLGISRALTGRAGMACESCPQGGSGSLGAGTPWSQAEARFWTTGPCPYRRPARRVGRPGHGIRLEVRPGPWPQPPRAAPWRRSRRLPCQAFPRIRHGTSPVLHRHTHHGRPARPGATRSSIFAALNVQRDALPPALNRKRTHEPSRASIPPRSRCIVRSISPARIEGQKGRLREKRVTLRSAVQRTHRLQSRPGAPHRDL